MSRKHEPIPTFRDETEERTFWENRDSSDFMDWSRAQAVHFPHLKPSKRFATEDTEDTEDRHRG